MTDTSKMREEFEAALTAEFASVDDCKPDLTRSENNGDYLNREVQGCWWAWQASRQAVVVELPDVSDHYGHSQYATGVTDCREAIEAAGLRCRVKP